jgi:D-alanyl-D-alanine carboxypeptidase
MNAAKAAGVGNITMVSGYRSYSTQKAVHADAVRKWGLIDGEKLAARPGFSEHQTGLAVDIYEPKQGCRIRVCFGTTKAGAWVKKNAWKYGFIIRYPDGETPTTGYQYEPWHLRFLGVELTTEMQNKGVTVLEKFWKYKPAPKY